MATIGSLTVKLGLVTVEWDKATAKAKQDAKDLKTAFNNLGVDVSKLKNLFNALGGAAGLSLAGVTALAHGAMNLADEVSDLSKGFGISIAKTLQFKDALTQAGGKGEQAAKVLGTLFSKIEEAQGGNESAIATFEQIGLSFEELRGMNPEEALNKVVDGLKEVTSQYERVKLIKELLGKGGLGVSLDDLAERMNMTTNEFKQAEKAMQSLGDLSDSLKATLENLKIAFAEMVAPFVGDGKFVINVNQFKAAMVAITAAGVVSGMFKLVEAFVLLNKLMKTTASLGIALSAAGGIKGIAMAGAGLAAYFGAKAAFDAGDEEAAAAPSPTETTGSNTQPTGRNPAPAKRGSDAAVARVALARQLLEIEKQRGELKVKALSQDQLTTDLAEVELKRKEEIARAQAELNSNLAKENLSNREKGAFSDQYNAAVNSANLKSKEQTNYLLAAREKELRILKEKTAYEMERYKLDAAGIILDVQRIGMTEKTYAYVQEILNFERRRLELNQQLIDAKNQYGEGKRYDAEIERINQIIDAETKLHEMRTQYLLAAREKELRIFKEKTAYEMEKYKLDAAGIILDVQRLGMTEKQYAYAQEIFNFERRRLELNQQLIDAKSEYGEGERYDMEAERINKVIDAETKLHELRMQSVQDKENQVRANQILTDSEKAGFDTMVGNLQSLGQHSKTAFAAWKAMAIAQTIIDTYSSAVGSYKALAGIPIIGPALGFTAAAIAVAAGMARVSAIRSTQYQGRAKGGVMSANQPYLVGEEGAEMVIPNQSSMVVPAGRTAGMMGNQPSVVYNGTVIQNMQAIDTQSAAQFLARNKDSVYAANMSAARGLPTSR